jgi:hypothetical protein
MIRHSLLSIAAIVATLATFSGTLAILTIGSSVAVQVA